MQCLSSASKAVLPYSHDHNVDSLPIQKSSRCWKASNGFFKLRRKAVKIQPHIREYRVRKRYKVFWADGILEKVALKWLRKGVGLRGYKPKRGVTDDDNEDILKDFRKEIVDRLFNKVSRVQSMVHCPEARSRYIRLRQTSQQAKDKSDSLPIEEVVASSADVGFADNDIDDVLMSLLLESPADSPGYFELWMLDI